MYQSLMKAVNDKSSLKVTKKQSTSLSQKQGSKQSTRMELEEQKMVLLADRMDP